MLQVFAPKQILKMPNSSFHKKVAFLCVLKGEFLRGPYFVNPFIPEATPVVWSRKDIDKLEGVQRRATKFILKT